MKIKDTKVGKWLHDKAPDILKAVGDALPTNGVLGIIKNLLDEKRLPPQDILEFNKMENEFITEISRIEMQDKNSAREREAEYIKSSGHADWMMIFVGATIMIAFFLSMVIVVYKPIPSGNEHVVVNAIGILEGLVLSIAGYYYGSSLGSRIKDMKER